MRLQFQKHPWASPQVQNEAKDVQSHNRKSKAQLQSIKKLT